MTRTVRASRWLTLAVGALGISALCQSAALADTPTAATWTQQHPATSPQTLFGTAMAYDAATGDVVMFGGTHKIGSGNYRAGTWIWDGTNWTRQAPAASPPALFGAAMAYDAATGDIVLFGGENNQGTASRQTWTWDGSTWTQQHPATGPRGVIYPAMAYDAAAGNIVMFGGETAAGSTLRATWVWNGSAWTQQVTSGGPSARFGASMAYDTATGNVVLFGGYNSRVGLPGTWTWNGSTWTEQTPAVSPAERWGASMAYDAADGNVVLFGGYNVSGERDLNDTWTWDGMDWTQQAPAVSPAGRYTASMAYDAATGNVVLFAGFGPDVPPAYGDTWTWG